MRNEKWGIWKNGEMGRQYIAFHSDGTLHYSTCCFNNSAVCESSISGKQLYEEASK